LRQHACVGGQTSNKSVCQVQWLNKIWNSLPIAAANQPKHQVRALYLIVLWPMHDAFDL
jgi:hypothetical protein